MHVFILVSFLLLTHGGGIDGLGSKNHSMTLCSSTTKLHEPPHYPCGVPHLQNKHIVFGVQYIATPHAYKCGYIGACLLLSGFFQLPYGAENVMV